MCKVNQSIGRAIRHASDYACVVLVDQRYTRESVQRKLPQWMQRHLRTDCADGSFGSSFGAIGRFFADKKPLQLELERRRRGEF